MDIKNLFAVLTIVCAFIFFIINYFARKNFFKKDLSSTNLWFEGRLILALFSPRDYIEKKNFWKGYILYLVSILFSILAFVFFYFFIKLGGQN